MATPTAGRKADKKNNQKRPSRGSALKSLSVSGRVSLKHQQEEARKLQASLSRLAEKNSSFDDGGSLTSDGDVATLVSPRIKPVQSEAQYFLEQEDEEPDSKAKDSDDDEDDDEWMYMTGEDMKAQKERSYAQMIEVMNAELQFWRKQVHDLYLGCAADLDPSNRSFRYGLVPFVRKPMALDDEEEKELKGKRGMKKADAQDEESILQSRIMDPSKLAFKGHAQPAEAGKILEKRFEELMKKQQDDHRSTLLGTMNRAGLKPSRHRQTGKRKIETRNRKDRQQVERRLNANLDKHVARSVNEITYTMPASASGRAGEPGSQREVESTRSRTALSRPSIMSDAGANTLRSSIAAGLVEQDADENWPIPLSDFEMDPRLFLTYACERVDLPSGARVFRHFVLSPQSRRLFIYLYWFIHCKFFQENSEKEQEHLLGRISAIYVNILQLKALEQSKDFFFKYYPYVSAKLVFWGFFYLCPGSRHLYTGAFRKILYKEVVRLLSGVDVCPISVNVLRGKLYPDEVPEDEGADDVDCLPPIRQGKQRNGLPSSPSSNIPENDDWSSEVGGLQSPLKAKVKQMMQSQSEPALKRLGGLLTDQNNEGTPDKMKAQQSHTTDSTLSFTGRLRKTVKEGSEGTEGTSTGRTEKLLRPSQTAPASLSINSEEKPIKKYTGKRETLRFKGKAPPGLTKVKPRQERETFDAAAISPMLQEFLSTSSTAGRRAEPMVRTVPVSWAATGSSDTFRRIKTNKEYHDHLLGQYKERKELFLSESRTKARTLQSDLTTLNKAVTRTFDKGEVGRKALDIVHDIEEKKKQKQKHAMQNALMQKA
eukprot:CAMPEP_0117886550 /NCGR_PEP_ID=MMETSP0950-20121206/20436_1 /TAXON_ID=44440 /ORGANISM="Chattonella subsalsa, Strain CCMP2191" /LENGTH=824 /DNA_ID=CAMNT_0005743917 /DNA_START=218 /DNA_END=2693 /DNA_ORIENTATION=-